MRIARPREQGFTLLEILVTTALTAIVIGMGFGIMTTAQSLGLEQQDRSSAARDGWSFVYEVSRQLREAVPPESLGKGAEWLGEGGPAKPLDLAAMGWQAAAIQEAGSIEASSDTIRFSTLRVMVPGHRPGPGMIEYSLKRDAKDRPVGILRRTTRFLVEPGADQKPAAKTVTEELTLHPRVVSLGFEYLDAQGQWQSAWKDAASMPRAVRVNVGTLLAPSRRIKVPVMMRFSTLVYIPTDSRIPR